MKCLCVCCSSDQEKRISWMEAHFVFFCKTNILKKIYSFGLFLALYGFMIKPDLLCFSTVQCHYRLNAWAFDQTSSAAYFTRSVNLLLDLLFIFLTILVSLEIKNKLEERERVADTLVSFSTSLFYCGQLI